MLHLVKLLLHKITVLCKTIGINYGNFIQCTIDFIIVAIAIFAVIKAMNALRTLAIKEKKEADEITPPEPTKEEALLTEIRDILKEKNK